MASSYSLAEDLSTLQQYYPYELEEPYTPVYNIGIYMPGMVITADQPKLIRKMHFSMVPFFFKERKSAMCNARSSQILVNPIFKQLVTANKRCLILADGFYIWQRFGAEKYPFRFHCKDRQVFAMAGLWSAWIDPETKERYESFCIVTTPANPLVREIRKSMPVILTPETEKLWLGKETSEEELLASCTAYPEEQMIRFLVSRDIADRNINDASLIKPLNYVPA